MIGVIHGTYLMAELIGLTATSPGFAKDLFISMKGMEGCKPLLIDLTGSN